MMLTIHFLSLPLNLKNHAFYIASLIPNSRLVATLFDVLHIRKKKETINTEKEKRIVYKNNWAKKRQINIIQKVKVLLICRNILI